MTVKNRTIFTGDNLRVLRGINSESIDLVYLDPPFNSKKQWSAPIGSKAAGAAFKDTWTLSDIDLQWHDQIRAGQSRTPRCDTGGPGGRRGFYNVLFVDDGTEAVGVAAGAERHREPVFAL